MRLSVVFELLLVFLFLAFAAAGVIDPAKVTKNVAKGNKKTTTLRQGPPNRYCACTSRMCNCCRDFSLPVVPIKGPGCASIMYVQKDTMMVTMSFGDRVLSNTTISGKTPKPICMALPGGISQFCGRIYGISRKGDQFRACLGLELRALDDIEAALRVSCFKFGPKGVRLESAPPVPNESGNKDPEDEDEDDYDLDDDDEDDDLIGFGVGDEDDDASSEDNEIDSDSVDYTGFSVLGEDILGTLFSDDTGSSSTKKKKPNKKTAKPQTVVLKTSTTTRRPIFPNRKKSTVRPLLTATKRPLVNRITRKPISTSKPQTVKKQTQTTMIVPQSTIFTTTTVPSVSSVMNKNVTEQIVKIKEPVTTPETFSTTVQVLPVTTSQVNDKLHSEVATVAQTEQSVTFTAPTVQTENVKNEIKLPLTDLEKLEAVAAIAQQDISSGFISSGTLSSEATEKPQETVTVKYEKITPVMLDSSSTYTTGNMEKINSVKFVATTVVTSRPSAEVVDEESMNNSEPIGAEKNSSDQLTTESTDHEEESDETAENEEISENIKIEQNSVMKKNNITLNLKKQPLKNKPVKQDEAEEDEEEEEEEEEDLLEGVLSDDEESDNEEAEEDESDHRPNSVNKDKNQPTSDKEEEEDDDEDDILGEAEETSEESKPTKVTVKKKPPKESNEEEEEEEEEEEDILDVLGDDVEEEEEEETDDDDDDDDDDDVSEKPTKKRTTTQATTHKKKTPSTQQTVRTRKPVPTTEKIVVSTTPEVKTTEMVTEKVFIYQKPSEQQTEKVIIYQAPENKIPDKIFIYKKPESQIGENPTQKIIIYNEPITEKFVIVKEEEEEEEEMIPKPTIPSRIVTDKSVEDPKSESSEEEKVQSDSDESDEDGDGEKHTVMASIIKPGFGNKYAEEHDLTEIENDDLDIEDTEGEDANDFEEDRKLKQSQKKSPAKPSSKKPSVEGSKAKVLTLSDLIRQRKKYHEQHNDDRPISTSRTHRRMNLDRLLQV